jgi:ammonia channel protein AmtB
MEQYDLKHFLLLIAAMILNVFFVWFGFKFLLGNNDFSKGGLFLMGCISTLAGVFALSSSLPNNQIWTIVLILVGVYFFARADGIIEGAWLSRLLGLASLVAAGIITYIAWPRRASDNFDDDLNIPESNLS